MPDTVIRIHQLSKKFLLGQSKTYKTFRDNIANFFHSPSKMFKSPSSAPYIWALQNINVEINQGDFVGIVGRNGAGKSTLLKILTRITEPTEGYVEIRGKTNSLLEVGTGFHMELTGRENIYLNGSILGMKRSEINKWFDQIVDFSGVHKFIDTQAKHYSTGMRVRLAFSVAAHLQPDILFIDEVLSVGDLEFQQKCLKKMKEVTSQGRTVILVSHNLAAIKEMCQKGILLNNGKLVFMGSVDETLARYSSSILIDEEEGEDFGSGWRNVSIDGNGERSTPVSSNQAFTVESQLDLKEDFTSGVLNFIIKDSTDKTVIHERITLSQVINGPLVAGRYRIKVELPVLWLAPGMYVSSFRFLGVTTNNEQRRLWSPQTIFSMSGSFRGMDHSRVLLHPSVHWELNPKSVFSSANLLD